MKGKNKPAPVFSDADRARFVAIAIANAKGRKAAAKAAGVSVVTISNWKAQLARRAAGQPEPVRRGITARHRVTDGVVGDGNVPSIPDSSGAPTRRPALSAMHIDQLQAQLEAALDGVKAMRAAYRQVFG